MSYLFIPTNHIVGESRYGEGVYLSDKELVSMLQKLPKTIPQLRTRSNFQTFFQGIDLKRMERLLTSAYNDIPNEIQKREKVMKRMDLLIQ